MKVSAKAEYACLALLELSLHRDRPEPLRVADIAERNAIPERFLVQILLQLKGAGYVQSVRGAGGGYNLAVDPHQVSVWDVVQLVDGPSGMSSSADDSDRGTSWQLLRDVWSDVNRAEEEYLRSISIAQLAERTVQRDSNMFYI